MDHYVNIDSPAPDDALGKLMHYNALVLSIFAQLRHQTPRRAWDFTHRDRLHRNEVIAVACMVSPTVLLDKVIFLVPEDSHFIDPLLLYQIYALPDEEEIQRFAVSKEIVIGHTKRDVVKFMVCTETWIRRNFIDPLSKLTGSSMTRNRTVTITRSYLDVCHAFIPFIALFLNIVFVTSAFYVLMKEEMRKACVLCSVSIAANCVALRLRSYEILDTLSRVCSLLSWALMSIIGVLLFLK